MPILIKEVKQVGKALDPACPRVVAFSTTLIDDINSGVTPPAEVQVRIDTFEIAHRYRCERCLAFGTSQ